MEELYLFRKELQNLGYCKTVVESYPREIARFLKYCNKPKEEITVVDVAMYYEILKITKSRVTKENLSPNTISGKMRAIRVYFDYLQRIWTRKDNPCQLKIKAPKSNERKVFTKEEIQKLYNKSSPLQTIILHLSYACGLRRTEATEVNIKDIDLENCLLYIRKGKGKKRRVIPFTKQVKKDIEFFLSTENKGENLLNITPERIYIEFKYLLKKTGLENQGFTLHCLRHTIATQLLEQGMELEKVRDFLGHQYLGTTQIYTRVNYGTEKIFRK
ncbi:tyrosine-type recombinase/integrase [Weeksellaceae bacterium A-14]